LPGEQLRHLRWSVPREDPGGLSGERWLRGQRRRGPAASGPGGDPGRDGLWSWNITVSRN